MLPGISPMPGYATGATGGAFSAFVSDPTVTRSGGTTLGSKTLTTASVQVTATGGAGGYTYAWVRIAGSVKITATAPAADSTAFTATLNPDESVVATFQCTVTDASGATQVVQVEVTMSLVNIDMSSGGTL